jgi:ABC transporter with metal-binding/Fe-S-binding domain ATP-binding protein
MKVAALLSGGKDSIFAIYIAQQWGWEVNHLVTLAPEKNDSWMFHSVNIALTKKIAEAINIPLIFRTTKGEKERELNDLKSILENLKIEGVISGAIASEYQRTRIEEICYDLNLKSFTPLWHKNQKLILNEQVSAGFEIIIVGAFAQGLDITWLGKKIDEESISELIKLEEKYSLNEAGEGGEFESLVLDGPIFNKKLILDETKKIWKRDSGIFQIKKSHIE